MIPNLTLETLDITDAGLYVSRRCSYFWSTVPYLARDPRRIDDVDSRGPDHAADACRYALGRERPRFEEIRLTGYW